MRQRGTDYFDILEKAAQISNNAAFEFSNMLKSDSKSFAKNIEKLLRLQDESHSLYRSFIEQLKSSFITPLDREDLIDVFTGIEQVTNEIVRTASLLNVTQIADIRPHAKEMADLVCKASKALLTFLMELRNFKKSKKLQAHVLKIYEIKKEANLVYYKSIKQLFLEERNSLLAIKWKSIFDSIEEIVNLMENTAKKTEAVVIKSL